MDEALGAWPDEIAVRDGPGGPSPSGAGHGRARRVTFAASREWPLGGPCWAGLSRWRRLRGLACLRAGQGFRSVGLEPEGEAAGRGEPLSFLCPVKSGPEAAISFLHRDSCAWLAGRMEGLSRPSATQGLGDEQSKSSPLAACRDSRPPYSAP